MLQIVRDTTRLNDPAGQDARKVLRELHVRGQTRRWVLRVATAHGINGEVIGYKSQLCWAMPLRDEDAVLDEVLAMIERLEGR